MIYLIMDKTQLSTEELNQFASYKYKVLPLISSRHYGIPILRDYHIGIVMKPNRK